MEMEMKKIETKKREIRESEVTRRIAEGFRKVQEKKINVQNLNFKRKLYWYASIFLLLVAIGFLIGWFSSVFHHTPRDADYYDDEPVDDGTCKIEGIQSPGHSCHTFLVCRNLKIVEVKCPKFQHFDAKSLSCRWIHLAECKIRHGGTVEEPPKIIPPEDVVPVDVDDDDDPEPPGPVGGQIPSLQQIIDTEVWMLKKHGITKTRKNLRTLSNQEVEKISPRSWKNPENVKILESVLDEKSWDYLFPIRHKNYTYSGFLQAVGKFPEFCSRKDLCGISLAITFAHFTQETGAHDPSNTNPEWRQGLYYLEESGCSNTDCGYSANCKIDNWLTKAWPCQLDKNGKYLSYHGRGAKQISYNYNYGQFSTFMYGNTSHLLQYPGLLSSTWLSLGSAIWFFIMPQPPKPSMLEVVEGTWIPNKVDESAGLNPGFGLTTNIINGGIECGKGRELPQSRNRQDYFRHFRKFFKVSGWEENGSCKDMDQFPEKGSGSRTLFWEQDWSRSYYCKLVNYQTQFSALVQGDYLKCVEDKFSVFIQ